MFSANRQQVGWPWDASAGGHLPLSIHACCPNAGLRMFGFTAQLQPPRERHFVAMIKRSSKQFMWLQGNTKHFKNIQIDRDMQ